MAHIEILAVLLAASILTACGQAEPAEADPAVFENTAWKQSPEETEKALGQDFSKESPPREEVPEGELLNCLYNSPITLPVSGAEAENASFLYWNLDGSFQLSEVRLLFGSPEETEEYRAYLDGPYGEAEEAEISLLDESGQYSAIWQWADGEIKVSYLPPETPFYSAEFPNGMFRFQCGDFPWTE